MMELETMLVRKRRMTNMMPDVTQQPKGDFMDQLVDKSLQSVECSQAWIYHGGAHHGMPDTQQRAATHEK